MDTLITTYLEMTSPQALKSTILDGQQTRIEQLQMLDVEFYLFLYRSVGEKWHWRDRLLMPTEDLIALLKDSQVYVLYVGGVPAGYVELNQQDNAVEIVYFGLRAPFIGRGLGKYLLSYGVMKAWEMQPTRVWLHTCNLDGPHALKNYQARGFTIYKEEREPMSTAYL